MRKRRGRRTGRGTAAWLLLAALGTAPAAASAGSCDELRSFAGILTAASGSSISVERGGRSTAFRKARGTRVVDDADTGVSGWGDLRKGLRVVVCWAFDEEPRAARIVFVTGG